MKQDIAPLPPLYTATICRLGLENQRLISRCLDLRRLDIARELKAIDNHLWELLHSKADSFDFVAAIAGGSTLLVGEGNFSFTASLIRKARIRSNHLTATAFERAEELPETVRERIRHLRSAGVEIHLHVDATDLTRSLGSRKFDSIVFQFPHTGSRDPIHGRNPNFILLRDFLINTKQHLHPNGKVLVTLVDSSHYQGAFQPEEAAQAAGLKPPESLPFKPSDFPGYEHRMTNEEESAIDNHRRFLSWVFRR